MALEQAYVATFFKDTKVKLASVAHRQARCARLGAKATPDVVVVARISMEGDRIFATWRDLHSAVEWCRSCPPNPLRWEWQDDARCKGIGDTVDMLGFSNGEHGVPAQLIAEYCHRCPVTRECAQFALDQGYVVGIWGGAFVPWTGERRNPALHHLHVTAGVGCDCPAILRQPEHAA